jgi:hypothetical protein
MKHEMKVETSPDRVIRVSVRSVPTFSRQLVGLQYLCNNFRTNRLARVNTRHKPNQEENKIAISQKFSSQWLISFPAKSEKEHTEVEQKIQISLIWIEENSYYSSEESMDYIKGITETENIIKRLKQA